MRAFGDAILLLKSGHRVARTGWNGKGMFLVYVREWKGWFLTETGEGLEGLERLPFIAMKTADNKVVPWLASQTDMLATDWEIVG